MSSNGMINAQTITIAIATRMNVLRSRRNSDIGRPEALGQDAIAG